MADDEAARAVQDEAMHAVQVARKKFPTIDPRGIGVYSDPYPDNQHSFHAESGLAQVDAAIRFLRASPVRSQVGAYTLKHVAERWSKDRNGVPYLSNGALIVAATYLNLQVMTDRYGTALIG